MTHGYEIVDSHIHFWEPNRPDRPYDMGGMILGDPLSVEQLLADAREAGVDRVLQVTPSIMGWDNEYAIESAERFPDRIVAVIGRIDPRGPGLRQRLAALKARKVVGVRVTLIKAMSEWLRDGTMEALLDEAGKIGMIVQIFGPGQPVETLAAAKRHPETQIFVDHMAVPYTEEEPFAHWADVLRLADAPNVWMKASAFPESSHEGFPFANVAGYFKELYERFGPDRLIWGSNYPPCMSAGTYKESVDFATSLPFLDDEAKAKILGRRCCAQSQEPRFAACNSLPSTHEVKK